MMDCLLHDLPQAIAVVSLGALFALGAAALGAFSVRTCAELKRHAREAGFVSAAVALLFAAAMMINSFETQAEKTNIVSRLDYETEETASLGALLLAAASGGTSFSYVVNPSRLDGTFSFSTNVCCAITGTGTGFTFACDGNCTCRGCRTDGYYTYEGFRISVWTPYCGCIPWSETPHITLTPSPSVVFFERGAHGPFSSQCRAAFSLDG